MNNNLQKAALTANNLSTALSFSAQTNSIRTLKKIAKLLKVLSISSFIVFLILSVVLLSCLV